MMASPSTSSTVLGLNFRRIFFDGASNFTTRESLVTHPREVKDSNEPSGRASHAPTIEDVCGTAQAHGSNANETVIVDEVDEDAALPLSWQNDTSPDQRNKKSCVFGSISDFQLIA
ncbi:hypothetical protein PVK06_028720 [Gossypium arboreum]|uniref:Uncharacterized protein n=1 Tax=Gossypium arboreum TaxID=29729 RepID=A0ABR0P4M0_GOSAR|nr:hypothetical protein PVK06_028720 [Gossypium arboreum]